jgi:PAS domain S-box-containing protein
MPHPISKPSPTPTPALIWVDAADQGRTLVNRAWREFTGAGPDDDLDDGWLARVHPDDAERCGEVRTAAMAGGEPFELEYRLRRADGRYRWVLERGAPLGAGTYVGSCLDIDDRLRERERRRMIDAVGVAMDTETSVAARRDVIVRTLVDEGYVDLARLVDMAGTPRTVAVAARRPEDADVLWGLDPPRRLDQGLIGAGAAQLITVDDDYLAGIAGGERQRAARAALGAHTAVAVPLRARGRMVGLLVTGRVGDSPPLEEDDAALLSEIGQRAAIALDNAELLAAEQATTRRLELLQRATAALSAAPSPRAVARTAVQQLRELLGTDAVAVWQRREGDLLLLDSAGFPGAPQWAQLPIAARTPFTDTARDGEPRFIASPDEGRRGYPETWADVPATRGCSCCRCGSRRTGWAPSPSGSPRATSPPTTARWRSRSLTSARTPCNARACSPPSRWRGAPRRGSRTWCRRCRARPPPGRSPP